MKKGKIFTGFIFTFVSLSFLMGCNFLHSSQPDADWTVMIYLSGNTLEDGQGSATYNLNEIVNNVTTNKKVNLVLQLGGATKWQKGENGLIHEEGKTETYIYENPNGNKQGNFRLIESKSNVLTGDPTSLISYI